ncbi:MAG TPA: DUF6132 family protein [bacterium]|nr:DUF6132 family protein [bacterium]
MNRYLRLGLGLLLGAAGGFAFYYFIGCRTGSCPITGNPYISSAYGALMGLLLVFPASPKKRAASETE